jgi:hypothetical protein
MRRKLVLSIVACVAVSSVALAQTQTTTSTPAVQPTRSEKILSKINKLDMLFFFLPLAMSKEQLNKILPVIEKARDRDRKVRDNEDIELAKVEAEVDKELKDAIEQGKVPSKDLHDKISVLYKKFDMVRKMIGDNNVDDVTAKCMEVWNAGQKKVAANVLDLHSYDPTLKPDQMKDEEKIKIFISEVMLTGAAYDVLVELSLKK